MEKMCIGNREENRAVIEWYVEGVGKGDGDVGVDVGVGTGVAVGDSNVDGNDASGGGGSVDKNGERDTQSCD